MTFIIVQDTDIVAVNRGKKENESSNIIYRDNTGLLHEIDFHTCALNYKAEHKSSSEYCIGERKSNEAYFLFYTSGIKTKVVFKKTLCHESASLSPFERKQGVSVSLLAKIDLRNEF